jgi:hypothetical protein
MSTSLSFMIKKKACFVILTVNLLRKNYRTFLRLMQTPRLIKILLGSCRQRNRVFLPVFGCYAEATGYYSCQTYDVSLSRDKHIDRQLQAINQTSEFNHFKRSYAMEEKDLIPASLFNRAAFNLVPALAIVVPSYFISTRTCPIPIVVL